ncbi:hypothetical protein [Paenibacillus sp. FJAT-26967]|uniref:hypothetical protein n=1 Tax=Paenibacillus sp. FJAT-26967 TaxID=1729690 RepID=UPI000837BFA0|nr:hypothetical protein [Paenibacillus sp. FJAT-26967]
MSRQQRNHGLKIMAAAMIGSLLAVSAAGCGDSKEAGAPASAPAATTAPSATPDAKAKASGEITQEPAGIKFQVEMKELKTFLDMRKEGPVVPALLQEYVPQGIGYVKDKNWILVSHYRKEGKSSLLTVIDAASGKMVKALELYENATKPYVGHAGGVTVSEKHVWISSDSTLFYVPIEEIDAAADKGKLTFKGSVATDTRSSFATYADGMIWSGEFSYVKDYPTEPSHHMNNRDEKLHKAWVTGFKLDPATDLLPAAKTSSAKGPVTPDAILSIPDTIQGMEFNKDGILLSQSYGRNNASTLLHYANSMKTEQPHKTVTIGADKVPLWFLDSKNEKGKLEAPPMSEGLVTVKDELYVLFESGANLYRSSSTYPVDKIQIVKWP